MLSVIACHSYPLFNITCDVHRVAVIADRLHSLFFALLIGQLEVSQPAYYQIAAAAVTMQATAHCLH
jgi:hypothetical protein